MYLIGNQNDKGDLKQDLNQYSERKSLIFKCVYSGGMPCFCFKSKMFCYLWTDKKTDEPYILMVEGKHLNHPELEEVNRSRMKISRISPSVDLPIVRIKTLLNDALGLYRNGIIKIK